MDDMLLLHPIPTCTDADAGPTLCTLYPEHCTLCLWRLSPVATYDGGISPSAIGTKTPLASVVVSLCKCMWVDDVGTRMWGMDVHTIQ